MIIFLILLFESVYYGDAAKYMGMGEVGVASAVGVNGFSLNPALISYSKGLEVSFTYYSLMLGTFYFSTSLKADIKDYKVGIVFKSISTEITGREGVSEEPFKYSFSSYYTGIGVARKLYNDFAIGCILGYPYDKIYEKSYAGFVLQSGASYRSYWRGFIYGAGLNFRTISQFPSGDYGFHFFMDAEIGIFLRRNFTLEIVYNPFVRNLLKLGIEYAYEGFFVRMGFQNLPDKRLSIGFGWSGTPVDIDYALIRHRAFDFINALTFSYYHERMLKQRKERLARIEELLRKKEMVTARSCYEIGMEYFKKGEYDLAIKQWELALLWCPDYREAKKMIEEAWRRKRELRVKEHLQKAKKYLRAGKYIEAIVESKEALKIDSTCKSADSIMKVAENILQEKIEKLSEIEEKLFREGVNLYLAGNYDGAIKKWKEVLKINPEHKEALLYIKRARIEKEKRLSMNLNMAQKYLAEGKWKLARKYYLRARNISPKDKRVKTFAYNYRKKLRLYLKGLEKEGISLFNQNRFLEAEAKFRKILEINPQNEIALSYIDKIKKKRISLRQKDIRQYYINGINAYAKDDFETAIYWWKKILEIDPENEKAKQAIKRAEMHLQKMGSL